MKAMRAMKAMKAMTAMKAMNAMKATRPMRGYYKRVARIIPSKGGPLWWRAGSWFNRCPRTGTAKEQVFPRHCGSRWLSELLWQ